MKCSICGTTKTLNQLEAELIEKSYKKHNKNLKAMALELGVGRATVYKKLKEYGII